MPASFTLHKEERLKSRKQIELLFKQGKSFAFMPFRVYYKKNEEGEIASNKTPVVFGVGVSSRNFKKAVDRNRIKRLTREAYRLQKTIVTDCANERKIQLNVFFIYTAKELPDFAEVKLKVEQALKRLVKITA